MKYAKLIGVPVVAMMLVGCSDMMDSTSNLIDTVAENIEEEPFVVAEPKEEAPQAEPVAQPKSEAAHKVEQDNSSMTHVRVTAEDANIREQPSLDAQVVTAGIQYNTYEYLKEQVHTSDGRTWYKVAYSHGVGYMSSAVGELTIDSDPPMMDEVIIIIDEPEGNVRAEPSLNSKIIYKGIRRDKFISTGETVNTSDGRTWYKVSVNGRTGFISDKVSTLEDDFMDAGPNIFIVKDPKGNVRAQPSIDSPLIYTAKQGEILSHSAYYEDTADGRRWFEVEINGLTGYISGAVGYTR